ncbi:hypothetical protein Bca101_083225 [Brassica carinata]
MPSCLWKGDSSFEIMSSSRKRSSSKSQRGCFAPGGSGSRFNDAVPKVEFEIPSVDPEDLAAYLKASGVVKPPRPGTWHLHAFRATPVGGCPSRSCPNGLDSIREFCQVPDSVEFCVPEAVEVAESPPEGYFKCFEVFLTQCHLWFLIPEVVEKFLHGFRLSISQINPSTLSGFRSCSTLSGFWC